MEVKSEIKKAREVYKNKKEVTLISGEMRSPWKWIKTMTQMPAKRSNCAHTTLGEVEDSVIAKDLNSFYSCFDRHQISSEINEIKHSCSVKDGEMEILKMLF